MPFFGFAATSGPHAFRQHAGVGITSFKNPPITSKNPKNASHPSTPSIFGHTYTLSKIKAPNTNLETAQHFLHIIVIHLKQQLRLSYL